MQPVGWEESTNKHPEPFLVTVLYIREVGTPPIRPANWALNSLQHRLLATYYIVAKRLDVIFNLSDADFSTVPGRNVLEHAAITAFTAQPQILVNALSIL